MAIVKMKRLSFHAAKSQREELLRELMLLGCVEISQPEPMDEDDERRGLLSKAPAGALERRGEYERLLRAIALLDKYAPKKAGLLTPRPVVRQSEIFDGSAIDGALKLAGELEEKEAGIRGADGEASRVKSVLESLDPWKGMDVPLDLSETKTCYVTTGMLPSSALPEEVDGALSQAGCESAVFEISSDKSARYVLLIVMKDKQQAAVEALRAFGFSQSSLSELKGTPMENIERLGKELAGLEKRKERLIEEIQSKAGRRDELKLCADRMMTKLETAENAERLLYTRSTFTFEGWIPAESEAEFGAVLSRYAAAWETSDPPEEAYPEVPVKLKNGRLTGGLNMVTEMYSLPAYGGVDPNPLMAPFFILFYGMMMADMAYGLIMIIAGILVTRKKKPRGMMGYMFELMIPCGISTLLWGAVTGGFFGDFIPQLLKLLNPESTFEWFWKPLFTPIDDTVMILVGSLALGFIHLMTGTVVSFVHKARNGKLMDGIWDEGSWWVIFIGIALAVLGAGNAGGVPVVLVVGLLMLVVGAGRNARGLGKITAAFGAIYNGVTGYFSDILSYSRLMALMLAGSVTAQVFNTLGAVLGGIVGFVLISLIGNALNLALNLLGCFVHDLRLQCLEYFGKFYEDGGRAFRPLAVNTQYYDIVKE